ncbi:MAG: hypothetical protein ABJN35_03165 [Erythrobacter sp.]
MTDVLAVIGKANIVALLAAVAAWLPMGILFYSSNGGLNFNLLLLALLGSFAVGLPVALLCFFMAGDYLRRSPKTVFLMANFAGIMLMLTSYAFADSFGLVFFGGPSLIAANVFAALGYLWIIKPQRETPNV